MVALARELVGDRRRPTRAGSTPRVALSGPGVEDAREQVAAPPRGAPAPGRVHLGRDRGGQRRVWGATQGPTGAAGPARRRRAFLGAATPRTRLAPGRTSPTWTASAASTPPRSSDALETAARHGSPAALVHCQAANHEVGTVQPVARGRRALPQPRRARPRRRAVRPAGHLELDLDDARRRPRVGERPQARRTAGGRGPRGPPGAARRPAPRRRRAGAGPPGRARERPGRRSGSAPPPRRCTGTGRLSAEATEARRRTDAIVAAATAVDGVTLLGDADGPAPPSWCAWPSTGSRPSRCCSVSTSTASPRTRARRARRSRWRRRRCSKRWASTPSARCGCRSGGPPPTTTSTPFARVPRRGGAVAGPAELTLSRRMRSPSCPNWRGQVCRRDGTPRR